MSYSRFALAVKMAAVVSLAGSFLCSTPRYHFTVTGEYIDDTFTGSALNGRTIGLCPLLTKDGPVDKSRFPLRVLADTLRRRRADLQYSVMDTLHQRFYASVAAGDRDRFYTMLYKGDMLSSSRFDTVWQALETDYLLVCAIRRGMSITTFNRVSQKAVRIEAELWHCSEYEVVWRANVDGSSYRRDLSDRELLCAGIGDIVATLPLLKPMYDNGAW